MSDKKAKRLLKNITFEHDGAHVALVHELQGGPANEYTTLITKANDEVTVTLSFKDFLTKFFNLWGDEADLLSAALGFEIDSSVYDDWEEGMSYKEWVEAKASRISIMKSLHSGEKSFETLEDEDFKFIFKAKNLFEKLVTSEATPEDDSSEDVSKSSVTKPTKEETTTMNEEELQVALEKAREEAAAEAKEELQKAQAELEELRKASEELKKQKEEQAKADMAELVKGYSFISEESREDVVEALLKSDEVMLEVLEKAAEAIKAAAETETGVASEEEEGTDVEKSRSRVREIIKARKAK